MSRLTILNVQLPYGAGDCGPRYGECKDGQRLTLSLPSRNCAQNMNSFVEIGM